MCLFISTVCESLQNHSPSSSLSGSVTIFEIFQSLSHNFKVFWLFRIFLWFSESFMVLEVSHSLSESIIVFLVLSVLPFHALLELKLEKKLSSEKSYLVRKVN